MVVGDAVVMVDCFSLVDGEARRMVGRNGEREGLEVLW